MTTKIQKWGNSFGVRLPQEIVRKRALRAGSRVEVKDGKDGIIIRVLADHVAKPSLAELLRGVTKDNMHKEITWGEARGNEVW